MAPKLEARSKTISVWANSSGTAPELSEKPPTIPGANEAAKKTIAAKNSSGA